MSSLTSFTVKQQGVKLITFPSNYRPNSLLHYIRAGVETGFLGTGITRRDVLYFYIETLKQRLDAINQLRVDRALAAMGRPFSKSTVCCRPYYIIITQCFRAT